MRRCLRKNALRIFDNILLAPQIWGAFYFTPMKLIWLFLLLVPVSGSVLMPVQHGDRTRIEGMKLTKIGAFGLVRKERASVPSHLHTGIDIQRPGKNYTNEPIFPIAAGKVISKRTDGAYAQLILEHTIDGKAVWSVYEHIAGIQVELGQQVNPQQPIARFMNKKELDQLGWQFDHLQLEILKVAPQAIKPDKAHPKRKFNSFTLLCFCKKDLEKFYYDPIEFFRKNLP